MADRQCAGYAQGFVADGNLAGCIRVEQRLRVEPRGRRGAFPWQSWGDETSSIGAGDRASRAHLRLNGDYGVPPDR